MTMFLWLTDHEDVLRLVVFLIVLASCLFDGDRKR